MRFVGLFTKRRSEFEFALSIHTSLGVDAANKTLGNVEKTMQEMQARQDMMLQMFQKLVNSDHQNMAKLVERRGGPKACMENEKSLRELYATESSSDGQTAKTQGGKGATKAIDIDELREELVTDPDAAMEKNMTVFNRKFEVQKRQIM